MICEGNCLQIISVNQCVDQYFCEHVAATDCCWKQIKEPVMKLYTETTDGSTIKDKETTLV